MRGREDRRNGLSGSRAEKGGDRALDHPPDDVQATAVVLATLGDHRCDAESPHKTAVLVMVAAAVREQGISRRRGRPTGPATRGMP